MAVIDFRNDRRATPNAYLHCGRIASGR